MQTPETYEAWLLRGTDPEAEVEGHAGGSLVALGAITVAPQINTNVGLNVAAANFAPVNQVLGQGALNLFSGQTSLRA